MAYRLAGSNKATDEDYVDDGEIKAGRRLLEILIDKDLYSIVVFIVHYYGGKHLGTRRFEIHRDLVNCAISDHKKEIVFTSKLILRQFVETSGYRRKHNRMKSHKSTPVKAVNMPQTTNTSSNYFALKTFNRFSALSTQGQTSADDNTGDYATPEYTSFTCPVAWGEVSPHLEVK